MRENAAAKARRLLAEGRVSITRVDGAEINALVRGDSAGLYLVQHRPGWWTCPCDAISTLCSHVQAVMLVTVVPGTWVAASDVMVSTGGAGHVDPAQRTSTPGRAFRTTVLSTTGGAA